MEYTAVVIATPIASERIAKTVKSVAPSRLRTSLMSLTTRGSVASLVAQGHKWIHSDGPARGHECGGDADDCRNGRDGHKRHRVDVRAIHVHAADPDVRRIPGVARSASAIRTVRTRPMLVATPISPATPRLMLETTC